MKIFFTINTVLPLFYIVYSAPQQTPEIKNQFEETNPNLTKTETKFNQHVDTNTVIDDQTPSTEVVTISDRIVIPDAIIVQDNVKANETEIADVLAPSFSAKLYLTLKKPFISFIETPKVNIVLRNIGTCIVNGAMEIVTFYFPAPLIPLIASAAGMVIPFEPVVMLRKRMPVTSYRRAFQTAVNSFMGTFENFKKASEENDPYMKIRFNRRFMGEPRK